MGELWNEIILIFILIMANAFFAASEIALVTMRSTRVKQLVKEGNRSAKAIQKLVKDPSRLLATIQIGVTLAGFMASAAAAVSLSNIFADFLQEIPVIGAYAEGLAVTLITVIISYFTLVLGELAPKRIAMQKAEKISLVVARPIDMLSRITKPFIVFLTWSTNGVVKLFGGESKPNEPKLSEEELRLMVSEQGTLNEEEKEMIQGIFEFGDTVAKEVMIPRTEMVALNCEDSIEQALEKVVATGYSRYPVFEKNIDNIIGIVTLKDLLHYIKGEHGKAKLKEIGREVYFIPETKNVLDLLKELQARRMHMAIVLDEYGGTAGLVTIEDLIEEIVGEINDEYNSQPTPIQVLNNNQAIFHGRVNVEDVNDTLNIDLPAEEDYDTIAGLIFHYLGTKPRVKDKLILSNAVIEVVEMERNRIKKVKVTRENSEGLTESKAEEMPKEY